MAEKLMRLKQVLEVVPVSKSTIWQWCRDGRFPAPIKLGERTTCWHESAVFDFIKAQG